MTKTNYEEPSKDELIESLELRVEEQSREILFLKEKVQEAAQGHFTPTQQNQEQIIFRLMEDRKSFIKTINILSNDITEILQEKEVNDGNN